MDDASETLDRIKKVNEIKTKIRASLPTISLGPCLYLPDVNSTPSVALVTKAGSVIDLVVFPQDARLGLLRTAIRHVSDPDNLKYAHMVPGYWDYTDEQKALKRFMDLKANP